jgi:lysophospholipase L1-like esterase
MDPLRRLLVLLLSALLAPALTAEDERPVERDSGAQPAARAGKLPVVWIAGDSTVRNNQGEMRGWGQELAGMIDPAKAEVMNRAIGGRSSRTFFTEGRWDEMLREMRPGDLVLVQFGHNDVGPLDERGKFRGSVKGIGDATEAVNMPDGSVETVRSYGWYLKYYARSAKAKGATVVLCSPVPHKKYEGDWREWREWVKACAAAEGVLYLDLCGIIAGRYARLEAGAVEEFFADKGTHTNAAGARFNARAVVDGMAGLPGRPLERFLKDLP